MQFSSHPLWLVGFRPFFALACLAGLSLPVIWALVFSGLLGTLDSPFSTVQWHAHEMFFGFGWAVLGGFLLTSTKNWVNIRGYHGPVLVQHLLMHQHGPVEPVDGLDSPLWAHCRRLSGSAERL